MPKMHTQPLQIGLDSFARCISRINLDQLTLVGFRYDESLYVEMIFYCFYLTYPLENISKMTIAVASADLTLF